MSDGDLEDRLNSLTPAEKLVYKVLEYEDRWMYKEEVADETRLPPKTVRKKLNKLDDEGLVEYKYDLEDARKKVFRAVKWTV